MIDKGETVEETAAREMLEETGLLVEKIVYKNDNSWNYTCDQ